MAFVLATTTPGGMWQPRSRTALVISRAPAPTTAVWADQVLSTSCPGPRHEHTGEQHGSHQGAAVNDTGNGQSLSLALSHFAPSLVMNFAVELQLMELNRPLFFIAVYREWRLGSSNSRLLAQQPDVADVASSLSTADGVMQNGQANTRSRIDREMISRPKSCEDLLWVHCITDNSRIRKSLRRLRRPSTQSAVSGRVWVRWRGLACFPVNSRASCHRQPITPSAVS